MALTVDLLLHDIELTRNVGSLFRIADALGVRQIIFSGDTPRLPNRKITRTSRSTENFVAYTEIDNPLAHLAGMRAQGGSIWALEITESSVPLPACRIDADQLTLVLGNERRGVSEQLLAACDGAVHIPMQGQNHSMNVSVATALAVYSLSQR